MPKIIERPRLNEDVIPLSAVRSGLTQCIAQTRRTHRPILITQNGTGSSVLLDVSDFEAIMSALELIGDVHEGERQIQMGEFDSHADFVSVLRQENRL